MLWDNIYDNHNFKKFVFCFPNNYNLWISLLRNSEKFNSKSRIAMLQTFNTGIRITIYFSDLRFKSHLWMVCFECSF